MSRFLQQFGDQLQAEIVKRIHVKENRTFSGAVYVSVTYFHG